MFLNTAPLSSHFSSLHRFTKVTLSQPKTLFPWIDSFKFGTPIRYFAAYLSLKFGDVLAESKGVMDDNITKKDSKSLVIPTG